MRRTLSAFAAAALLVGPLLAAGCIKAQPPSDTGDPFPFTTPSGPTSTPAGTAQPLAYDPDLKAIFASDCVTCHGGFRVDGNYRMTTYAEVMKDVRAGDAASRLVVVTQPSGSMYRYWSGSTANRQAKANAVFQWVVTYRAAQTK
jgi:mono/diheme cytochrome c family protein